MAIAFSPLFLFQCQVFFPWFLSPQILIIGFICCSSVIQLIVDVNKNNYSHWKEWWFNYVCETIKKNFFLMHSNALWFHMIGANKYVGSNCQLLVLCFKDSTLSATQIRTQQVIPFHLLFYNLKILYIKEHYIKNITDWPLFSSTLTHTKKQILFYRNNPVIRRWKVQFLSDWFYLLLNYRTSETVYQPVS